MKKRFENKVENSEVSCPGSPSCDYNNGVKPSEQLGHNETYVELSEDNGPLI